MSKFKIPFNKPTLTGRELSNIEEAIRLGHASGDGSFTKRCATFFENTLGVKRALLTTSCTHALEMAAILLNFKEGDEFIVPSFTFVSTANAFVLRGAKPVFADICPKTLNIDVDKLESLITSKTKAILPVHYAGVPCEMDKLMEVANRKKIPVVEDNAHGLFGKYKGKYLGTFGALSTLSFHETKNLVCGEGGALLVNDESLTERAEIIREKGTDRSKFFRGLVDKYGWVDIGSSYVMSDILAAFLFAQLESWKTIQGTREKIWKRYNTELSTWAKSYGVTLPHVPSHTEQAYHMFYLLFPDSEMRDAMISHLKAQDILSVFHYVPLNSSTMGKKLGGYNGQCPVTEDISMRLLRLPFYNSLTENEQTKVIESVQSFGASLKKAA